MATVAISGLPAATGVAGADVTPIVQSATTKKVTFSAIFAAPPAIGGTTPAAGAFTTLSATGAVTFTGTNQTTTLGVAGTSTEASAVNLDGGTGAGGGGVVQFLKNGALTGAVAMASRLLGGTTSNMTYYAASGLGHNWYVNGNITVGSPNMSLGSSGGLQMGAPTGADKGAGTANFAADIYKNNTAYTNPDYVLEHWATGQIVKFADKDGAKDYTGLMSLKDTEAFARQNLHLPRFGQQAEHGLFSGSDALLASVEEAYLHLFDHDSRITDLLAWKAKAETALDKAGITI